MIRALRWRAGMAAAAAAVTATSLLGTSAAQAGGQVRHPAGQRFSLVAANSTVQLVAFGPKNRVYLDPGIWVGALGSDFRVNVAVPRYGGPKVATEVLRTAGGTVSRRLPFGYIDGFNGLSRFVSLAVRDSHGTLVLTRQLTFCPDSYDPERFSGNGPFQDPYPNQCNNFDPFTKGAVWGLSQGWAVNPSTQFGFGGNPLLVSLKPGRYRVTESIEPRFRRLFGLPAGSATATDTVIVTKAGHAARQAGRHRLPGHLPLLPANVPVLRHPPASVLPDMIPLPSWGIYTSHQGQKGTPGADYLNFGATVWIGGHSQLDVEGFRSNGSPVMPAWQYFFRNGKVIGRARAGTMGFDSAAGHGHWHFQQFAQYKLLNAAQKAIQVSGKVGFCIAPTDSVDLLLRGAQWQPSFIGFSGQCGSPTALWVRESLPLGWGDTYDQSKAGQGFDISHLPNGTYYIQVIANPLHVLHEANYRNDVSLRKVIISGTPGHRHVTVPRWHGLDYEHH